MLAADDLSLAEDTAAVLLVQQFVVIAAPAHS